MPSENRRDHFGGSPLLERAMACDAIFRIISTKRSNFTVKRNCLIVVTREQERGTTEMAQKAPRRFKPWPFSTIITRVPLSATHEFNQHLKLINSSVARRVLCSCHAVNTERNSSKRIEFPAIPPNVTEFLSLWSSDPRVASADCLFVLLSRP